MQTTIIKNLKSQLPNVNIVTTKKPLSGISTNVLIEEFKYVSGAKRFFAGVFAGKAILRAKVNLVNIASNENIGETTLGTSSKISEGIFGGTTGQQIEAVAQKIVSLLKSS